MKIAAQLLAAAALAAASIPAVAEPVVATSAAVATGNLRYTIAVVKFNNASKYTGSFPLADTWTSILTDSLVRCGHFVVAGEADMRTAAMTEQNFAKSGRAANGDKSPAIGYMTPAQLLIKGEITNYQDGTKSTSGGVGFGAFNVGVSGSTAEINVVVYVVDATTGQVVATQKVVGKSKSSGLTFGVSQNYWNGNIGSFKQTNVGKAVEAAIDQSVNFIVTQLPSVHWTGTIILIRNGQIYINRGQREGVVVGEHFKVGATENLRDPGTGELLDTEFTTKGEIKVETVREKLAICSVVSGDGLAAGMSISPL